MQASKQDIISQLKKSVLEWEGFKAPLLGGNDSVGLGAIEQSFPNGVFPAGAIHEFITATHEQEAVSTAFIAGILGRLMENNGPCLWISPAKDVFPAALKHYGVEPDRFIFIRTAKQKDILWIGEEALKCNGIAAVILELPQISFQEARRLQLCVEKSNTTGFVLRTDPSKITSTPCVARWNVTPMPSSLPAEMPGVGFSCWSVELQKVRNGNPGQWRVQWMPDGFQVLEQSSEIEVTQRKVG